MQNKKAEGTVWACVITVIACMLIAISLTFFEALESVKLSKKEAKTVLNAMMTENAVEAFGTLRDSENNTDAITQERYTERLIEFADLIENNERYEKTREERTVYSITSPVLTADSDTVRVTYSLSVPLYFASREFSPVTLPVTVTAKFRDRVE